MSTRVTLADSLRFVRQKWREKHPRKCYCGTLLEDRQHFCSDKCADEAWEWTHA